MKDHIKIVEFEPRMRGHFEVLNRKWIEKYFEMEAKDYEVLPNPERAIINHLICFSILSTAFNLSLFEPSNISWSVQPAIRPRIM